MKNSFNHIIVMIMIILSQTVLLFAQDPDINVTPASFTEQIPYGSSISKSLTIQNLGDSNLQWSIPTGYDTTSTQQYISRGASTIHNLNTGLVSDDATLTVTINGDFDSSNEYAEVIIEGTNLGQIQDNNVSNGTDIVATYTFSSDDMSTWTSDSVLSVSIDNSYDVYTGYNQTHKVRLEIQGLSGWLSLSKSSGTLGSNQSETIDVTFNTTSLDAGNYTDEIKIESNDPDEAEVTIPVSLTVLGPSISINPTQLSTDLYEGDSLSTSLTISNSGQGLLDFSIQLSTQPPDLSKGLMKNNNSMGIKAALDNIIQRSGILNHEIRVNSVEKTTGEQKESVCSSPEQLVDTKYANTTSNSGLDVAILGADTQVDLQDVQSKLISTNKFNSVTIIDVRIITPTLTELKAFNAVIVYDNYDYYEITNFGNNLADYVDQGGGVVCMMFECGDDYGDYLKGRWNSKKYYVIERSGHYYSSRATLGTISVPNHSIMQGVSSFDGGYRSYRTETTNLTSGATLVASWSDGRPLVAVKKIGNVNRVDLGFYPISNSIDSYFWDSTTDGALLMANALIFAAGGDLPWCKVDPKSGSIQSNNSQQINVTFNASAIDQGKHQGYLLIENNDPNNSKLNAPLTLNITDNTPPGAVSDLKMESVAANFALFSWTAPGDNGTRGIAESYELRYSNQPITESSWSLATSVTDTLPVPASPGTQQTIRITNLTANTTYYFALKTKDEADLYSPLSNVLEVKTTKKVEALIYLPFEEISGEEALNYQGDEDFNGQLTNFDNLDGQDVATNSGWTQFGFKGSALKFDGSNDYVSIPDYSGSPLHLNTALTLNVVVKSRNDILPTGNSDFYEIISKINNSSGYALRFNLENGRLRFLIQFGSGNVGIYESTQSAWAGGQWYNIMVTFDYNSADENVKIYVDNKLDASYKETRLLTINDRSIAIGGGNTSYWEFPGSIDEVLIHNKVLEPDVNHPPSAFNLLYPENNVKLDTLNFTFQWETANDVDEGDQVSYKLYLSDDFTFENTIFVQALEDVFYTIESGLSADAVYYWKVVAIDAESAETECSKIFSFRTSETATSVKFNNPIPKEFKLSQNYPNPFNPTTTINYSLPKKEYVVIKIFNINGGEVKTLFKQEQSPGIYSITWDGKNNQGQSIPSGLYLYQINAGEFKKTLKMSLIK